MFGFITGLLYANFGEWVIHKYLLHDEGKNSKSFFSFHWKDHHKNVRRQNYFDYDYDAPLLENNAQGKELLGLAGIVLAHAPLLPVAPGFTLGIYYNTIDYYLKHKKSHLDPEWAKEHLPWHYDHHMGPNQDANWCVTHPWFDILLGTREPYVGTAREQEDLARKKSKMKSAPARQKQVALPV